MTETATPAPSPLEGIIVGQEDAAQLVTVKSRPVVEIFTTPGLVPALLAAVRAEAAKDFTPDVTTAKGREAIKAQAFKVTKTKTYLEDMGKAEAARLKALVKPLDEGRRALWDGLEKIQAETRKPLTEWEERRDVLQSRLIIIQRTPTAVLNGDAITIRSSIETVEAMDPAAFDEFSEEAATIKTTTLAALRDMLEKRQQFDHDQAELARLREEERIRKEEEEKERLRLEGEARARERAKFELAQPVAPAPAPAVQTTTDQQAAPMVVETPLGALPLPAGATGATVIMDNQEPVFVPATPASAATSAQPPAPVTMGQADALRRGEPLTQAATDVEHRRTFNREALADLLKALEEAQVEADDPTDPAGQRDIAAKAVLTAIVTGKIRHITMTY